MESHGPQGAVCGVLRADPTQGRQFRRGRGVASGGGPAGTVAAGGGSKERAAEGGVDGGGYEEGVSGRGEGGGREVCREVCGAESGERVEDEAEGISYFNY